MCNLPVFGQKKKELYIPEKVYRVPDGNDYHNNDSEYSYHRMVESANIAVFWSKEFGDDPMVNPDTTKRFHIHEALEECERFYDFYIDTLGFATRGESVTDQYKILFYVIGGDGGTAFGGGSEKIGILWSPPVRMNKRPYAALAHEVGHSFQYLVSQDGGRGLGGPMAEMTSQYMLWQVYPEWMTFENYHLNSFMEKTHFAFMHPTNMYHSPYVLEYWSGKHGKEFVGRLWREAQEEEDVVAAYKRIAGVGQQAFNDEIFDAYQRFITWDMDRIREVASPYANQHFTKMLDVGDGWYRIDSAVAPQNYGYNGIKLAVPLGGTDVTVNFEGVAGRDGYSQEKLELAGWRYGFVAQTADANRVYSEVWDANNHQATFTVPQHTKHLWLVVMGAPLSHWPVPMPRRGQQLNELAKPEQWPYQIQLSGTTIDMGMVIQ